MIDSAGSRALPSTVMLSTRIWAETAVQNDASSTAKRTCRRKQEASLNIFFPRFRSLRPSLEGFSGPVKRSREAPNAPSPSIDLASALASRTGTPKHLARHADQPHLASAVSDFVCSLNAPRSILLQLAAAGGLLSLLAHLLGQFTSWANTVTDSFLIGAARLPEHLLHRA